MAACVAVQIKAGIGVHRVVLNLAELTTDPITKEKVLRPQSVAACATLWPVVTMGCRNVQGENRMSKGPWMRIAPPEEATGDLKRAYDRIRTTRGRIPDIRSVMAGEPLVVEGFASFFPENNYACSSIDRRLAEMIATVASVANGSGFGAPAHARQLAKITGDQSFSDSTVRDYRSAGLPGKERVLLDYVWKLSRTPGEMTEADMNGLRAEGWTDPQIVATIHVTAFFAYMNRVAEAFGLSSEPQIGAAGHAASVLPSEPSIPK